MLESDTESMYVDLIKIIILSEYLTMQRLLYYFVRVNKIIFYHFTQSINNSGINNSKSKFTYTHYAKEFFRNWKILQKLPNLQFLP